MVVTLSHQRSQVANATKSHKARPTDESRVKLDEARRALAEQKITEFVQRAVAAAPPLTDEQKSRLSSIFQSATS